MKNKFYRVNQNAWVGGVCGGLAYYLDAPAWIVRAITLIIVFGLGGTPVVLYLLALMAPQFKSDPENYKEVCE